MLMNREIKRPLSASQQELMDKLMSEINNSRCKAVTMKMKDVLINLPFSDLSDMFGFMEDEFSGLSTGKDSFTSLRVSAGDAALRKAELPVRVKLDKIYDIFRKLSGVSQLGIDRLKERECELFEHFAFPRECGKQLFRCAKDAKKRVIIVAETIYPREVIEHVLENCGYGSYDGLVVVSEIKDCTGKSWFSPALEKAGVSADRLLHIGGDIAFDVELAITHGAKALMMSQPSALMSRSGRLAEYIAEKKLLDYDKPEYLAIRCMLGLYAVYGFDVPQNKVALSDFCGDKYMMGFIVLGALSRLGDGYTPSGRLANIIKAMVSDETMLDGKDDFELMFEEHFGDFLDKYGYGGCEMPAEFVEKFCASGDREFFTPYLSPDMLKKWASSVKEPDIVNFRRKNVKRNSLQELADKMFPPETKVRNIVDDIMGRGKNTIKRRKKRK